jgi:type II secretory pathway pseudopilin PulG
MFNILKFKKYIAFTLAEVLITLLIIGVVASIVIPGLINNTQEAEYNEGVKKLIADLSSAVKMIQINNGGSVSVGLSNAVSDWTAFRDDFCNVMNCTKIGTGSNIFGGITYKYYKAGTFATFNSGNNSSAALNNGTLLDFVSYNGCNNNGVNACGYVYADINGQKGPNMVGKDFYLIYIIKKDSAYLALPLGSPPDSFNASSTCVIGNGRGCGYIRLTNPANMP